MRDEQFYKNHPMHRPGINFTPEQEVEIRAALGAGRVQLAQQIMLAQLIREDDLNALDTQETNGLAQEGDSQAARPTGDSLGAQPC